MKRLMRWGIAAVLAGSTAWSVIGRPILPAQALNTDEISDKLGIIPVFLLIDGAGNMVPLSFSTDTDDSDASSEEDERQSFFAIFISQSDAEETLSGLREGNPDISDQIAAVPIPLGDAYRLILESRGDATIPPFAFIPQQEQLVIAAQVLADQGEEAQFSPLTVPLFHLSNSDDDSYVTVSRDEDDPGRIPLFFDGNEAQAFLDILEQQNASQPDAESQPDIELDVVFLHQWLQIFETNDNEALGLIELVPIPESEQFLLELINETQQPAEGLPTPDATPAPQTDESAQPEQSAPTSSTEEGSEE